MAGAPGSEEEMRHLPFIAKIADDQVGRILDTLEAEGLLEETLVVLTADHGAQTGERFHGRFDTFTVGREHQRVRSRHGDVVLRDSFGLQLVLRRGCRRVDPARRSVGSGTRSRRLAARPTSASPIRTPTSASGCTTTRSPVSAQQQPPCSTCRVIAGFHLNASLDGYDLFGKNAMTGAERRWFDEHAEELLDTMAAPFAPDVVALLKDATTYGVMGDHGGHQRLGQRIPLVFSWPGLRPRAQPKVDVRLVDVLPTVLDVMDIRFDGDDLDGQAVPLPVASARRR